MSQQQTVSLCPSLSHLHAVFSHVILANEDARIIHQDIQWVIPLLILLDKILDGPAVTLCVLCADANDSCKS